MIRPLFALEPATMPGFWRNETTGVLAPAVHAFLAQVPMTGVQIAAMRAYFRQWIAAPGFVGEKVEILRAAVDRLTTQEALDAWYGWAIDAGVDPL